MSLHALPPELITHIYAFLDPSSHLNFALTDRQIAYNSRDILAYHRKCAALYRCISDTDLSLLTAVIKQILTDPIAAWHVRNVSLLWKCQVNNTRTSIWSHTANAPTPPMFYVKPQRMPLDDSAELEKLEQTVFDDLISLQALARRPTEDPLRVLALILSSSTVLDTLALATLTPRMMTADEADALMRGEDVLPQMYTASWATLRLTEGSWELYC